MTAKSVIDIDVSTEKWSRFQQLFDRYAAAAAKQPKVWADVGKSQEAAGNKFERMTAAMDKQLELAEQELKARKEEERTLGNSERHWQSIEKSSRGAQAGIASAGSSLSRWTPMLTGAGVAMGVLGAAAVGVFETMVKIYEKSADTAKNLGQERFAAMGFGMSVGEHRAFGLDLSRITDTDSFLGNVEEMMTDPGKAGPLWRAGINPNGSVTQVATRYMDWQRNLAVNTPVNRLGLLNQQYGSQVGIDTWMRLHNMSPDEYGDIRNQFETDRSQKGGLSIDDRRARSLQNFATQDRRAGLQTDNIFERKVAKLIGPLTDLSKGIVGFERRLANTRLVDKALEGLGAGMKWLSGKFPDIEKGIGKFERGLLDLADEAKKVAGALKKLNDETRKLAGEGPKEHHGIFVEPFRRTWGIGKSASDAIGNWLDSALDKAPPMRAPPEPEGGGDLDLSTIIGDHPTSWNPAPISNSYAANRSNVSNTTNNYGGRGGGSVNINIIAPPGFSANTTLAGLNAGLV